MSQSRKEVCKAIKNSPEKELRPILTLLNGDASWLMSFPRPRADQVSTGKAYYHIVYEPWLQGDASMFGAWFFNVALSAKAAITDVRGIEELIREIEEAAACHLPTIQTQPAEKQGLYKGNIDVIMLAFHFVDHVHEPTLRTFDLDIPVIATPEAAAIIRPWNHFKTICLSHDLDSSAKTWRSKDLHAELLPDWLTVIRLPSHAVLNFCTALIWTHETDMEEIHETILISPHGTHLDQGPLDAFLNAEPKTELLTMLHGLKESYGIRGVNKLGAKGGLALYRKIGGTKSWILNHDNDFTYSGVWLWISRTTDLPRSIEWALEEERKQNEGSQGLEVPNFIQIENGGVLVLER
ncbi:hypothetical protein NW762_003349 [Fusarium torreyae]|uniref:Uncharacterized protein n=1 Tax=Fusarium torreyae TaxID=1237075 RepID=A0A9W8VIT6_9HYPO|nr:hypothetical protein NW762_003349 [Fusarium torreyae]